MVEEGYECAVAGPGPGAGSERVSAARHVADGLGDRGR